MSTSGPLSSRIAGNATHPSSQASPRRAAGLGSRSNSSTPRNLQCSESAAAQDGPSNPRRATALSAAGVPLRNPLTVPAGGAPTSADDRPSPAATAHESLSWSEHPDPRLSCTTGSNDRASGAVDAIWRIACADLARARALWSDRGPPRAPSLVDACHDGLYDQLVIQSVFQSPAR